MSRITPNAYTALANAMLYGPLNQADATPAEWYKYLHAYYLNNGVYDAIQQAAYAAAVWTPNMKGLLNPSHRAVEFYVAKLWPGSLPSALPIVTDNDKIIEPIQKVWAWSNWGANKQVASRWVSEYGDWFAKVSSNSKFVGGAIVPATRVFFQNIKPEHVIDFDVDERGFITFIHIERTATKKVDGKRVSYVHVEIWDKETALYRCWELTNGQRYQDTPPAQLVEFDKMGVDFVPFIHAKFQDIGEKRGVGCFVHALDKIDEVNRMATRLHQILFRFNKPTTAVSANMQDAQGRPLPAPSLDQNTAGMVEVPDSDLWRMPGMSKIEFLVPPLQYDSYLNAIKDQMNEIKQDLPEIKYFEMGDTISGDPSGKAIRLLLGDAVDKVIELRGSMESALARLDMMALTIMQNSGLVSDIGTFDNGDFDHTFAERDVIALSMEEKQDMDLAFWHGWSELEGGTVPFPEYAKSMGWSDKRVADYLASANGKKLSDKTAVAL